MKRKKVMAAKARRSRPRKAAKGAPGRTQALMVHLAEGFVREGLLVLPTLTDDQLEKELSALITRFIRDEEFDYALTFDHTNKLLLFAKGFEDQHELELCCLFYMLWIEHQINLTLRVMLRRIKTTESDAIAIVRKLAIREKLGWLWQLLGLDPFPAQATGLISTIEECRNGFVHFKWQSFTGFEQEEKAWQAVNDVQEVIAALKAVEETHVFFGQRHRLWEAVAKLK